MTAETQDFRFGRSMRGIIFDSHDTAFDGAVLQFLGFG